MWRWWSDDRTCDRALQLYADNRQASYLRQVINDGDEEVEEEARKGARKETCEGETSNQRPPDMKNLLNVDEASMDVQSIRRGQLPRGDKSATAAIMRTITLAGLNGKNERLHVRDDYKSRRNYQQPFAKVK
jgi:hypothetical protein